MVSWHWRLNSQCNVLQTGFPPDGANLIGYGLAANQDDLCNSKRNKLVCARVKCAGVDDGAGLALIPN